MQLLLAEHPTLLHVDEIRREASGDRVGVDDALAYFERAGLVHVLDGFYWATRTAMAAEEAATAHIVLEDRGTARSVADPLGARRG
jgi:hypothetical protein